MKIHTLRQVPGRQTPTTYVKSRDFTISIKVHFLFIKETKLCSLSPAFMATMLLPPTQPVIHIAIIHPPGRGKAVYYLRLGTLAISHWIRECGHAKTTLLVSSWTGVKWVYLLFHTKYLRISCWLGSVLGWTVWIVDVLFTMAMPASIPISSPSPRPYHIIPHADKSHIVPHPCRYRRHSSFAGDSLLHSTLPLEDVGRGQDPGTDNGSGRGAVFTGGEASEEETFTRVLVG